jgi:glycopeptide antibiotics resistance protein
MMGAMADDNELSFFSQGVGGGWNRRNIFAFIFFCYLLCLLCVTLYPFNFYTPNGVQWLFQDAGLYFNGNGIAYSKQSPGECAFSFGRAISIEIHIKERRDSNNSGPRELISLYDGRESPPLLIGMWYGQIFLYSRFERHTGQDWYNEFRPSKKIIQGEEYYITIVYGEGKKALYCNGVLVEEQGADFLKSGRGGFSGQIVVGSSPFCKHGWMGEIRGIAIYDHALSSVEAFKHYKMFYKQGMCALAGMQGLSGLYDCNDRKGTVIQNKAGAAPSLNIPELYRPVKKTIIHNTHSDMRFKQKWIDDFMLNAFLFIPSGFLLARLFTARMTNYLVVLFYVCLVCAAISLAIEAAQIFIPVRYPSFYDVFANVLGAGTGAGVTVALSIIQVRG